MKRYDLEEEGDYPWYPSMIEKPEGQYVEYTEHTRVLGAKIEHFSRVLKEHVDELEVATKALKECRQKLDMCKEWIATNNNDCGQ